MAYSLSDLQTDIRGYTEVGDNVFTDAVLKNIIINAENTISRAIDTDQDRFYATSSLIIGNRYVTIPSDLRAIRYVQLTDSNGSQFFLEQRDTSFMAEFYAEPGTAAVDIPRYYGNWDEEFWLVAPTPDKTYQITLSYNKQPTSITVDTAGTYISNKYQDLLLYACLVNAYGYLKGPQDMIQYYNQSYEKALMSYAIEQQGRRRRDEYQDQLIQIKIDFMQHQV